ncbi:MAG TPA: transcription negative regulator ChrR [Halomonas sp.]|jgi:anti-sigma factor ChrR (cupin superfamily)|nr:transcription negative regulator ChrR [Halomonas sp.]
MNTLSLFRDAPELTLDKANWLPFRPGIEVMTLHGEPTKAGSSALLRYQPGARVPAHYHHGVEHILVLQGSQEDEQGCHEAGTLVINPAQSSHSVISRHGCTVLAIWHGDLEPLKT